MKKTKLRVILKIGDNVFFKTYEEIPVLIREYVLTVADQKSIMDIPLEDINSFIDGLHKYHETKSEIVEDCDGTNLY